MPHLLLTIEWLNEGLSLRGLDVLGTIYATFEKLCSLTVAKTVTTDGRCRLVASVNFSSVLSASPCSVVRSWVSLVCFGTHDVLRVFMELLGDVARDVDHIYRRHLGRLERLGR